MLISIYGSALYLGAVYSLRKIMKYRTPVEFDNKLILAYNIYQVVANAYIAIMLYAYSDGNVFGIGMSDNTHIRHYVYLHYLTKYVDFIDTALILMKKKENQLSFLHIYHHSTVVVIWDWVVHTWPIHSAAYMYGAWINSWIHVLMYTYYGLTSIRINIHPSIKKSVTTMQILQFISCTIHAIAALLIDFRHFQYNTVQFLYHITLFKLFYPLLNTKKQIIKKI